MSRAILSQDELKHLLDYNSGTGVFTWRVKSSRKIRIGTVAGCERDDGYRVIKIVGRMFFAHRLAWLYVYGVWPKNIIDHMNGNPADNRIDNLRDVTAGENQQNQIRVKGYRRKRHKWQALIHIDGVTHCIGTFHSNDEAHAAYLAAKKIHHPTSPINERSNSTT